MGFGPSRQMRDGTNHGDRPVMFKLADAERIAQTVAAVEGARRGRKSSFLPRAAGSGQNGIEVVDATYVGAWPKGASKYVSPVTGNLFTAATTLLVVNNLGSVMPGGTRNCFVLRLASNTNSWTLLNAEC